MNVDNRLQDLWSFARSDGECVALSDQLSLLTQLNLDLAMNEVTAELSGFVPVLQRVLSRDYSNSEVSRLALLALNTVFDLDPLCCVLAEEFKLVDTVCAKLSNIKDLDLAEESLKCLIALSAANPRSALNAGALRAVTLYFSFFPERTRQKVIAIVSNLSSALVSFHLNASTSSEIEHENYNTSRFVIDALPLIDDLLESSDSSVSLPIALSFSQFVEAYSLEGYTRTTSVENLINVPEKWAKHVIPLLCSQHRIRILVDLLETNEIIDLTQICCLFRCFGSAIKESPSLAKVLFEKGITEKLRQFFDDIVDLSKCSLDQVQHGISSGLNLASELVPEIYKDINFYEYRTPLKYHHDKRKAIATQASGSRKHCTERSPKFYKSEQKLIEHELKPLDYSEVEHDFEKSLEKNTAYWACHMCTYHNEIKKQYCEVCGTLSIVSTAKRKDIGYGLMSKSEFKKLLAIEQSGNVTLLDLFQMNEHWINDYSKSLFGTLLDILVATSVSESRTQCLNTLASLLCYLPQNDLIRTHDQNKHRFSHVVVLFFRDSLAIMSSCLKVFLILLHRLRGKDFVSWLYRNGICDRIKNLVVNQSLASQFRTECIEFLAFLKTKEIEEGYKEEKHTIHMKRIKKICSMFESLAIMKARGNTYAKKHHFSAPDSKIDIWNPVFIRIPKKRHCISSDLMEVNPKRKRLEKSSDKCPHNLATSLDNREWDDFDLEKSWILAMSNLASLLTSEEGVTPYEVLNSRLYDSLQYSLVNFEFAKRAFSYAFSEGRETKKQDPLSAYARLYQLVMVQTDKLSIYDFEGTNDTCAANTDWKEVKVIFQPSPGLWEVVLNAILASRRCSEDSVKIGAKALDSLTQKQSEIELYIDPSQSLSTVFNRIWNRVKVQTRHCLHATETEFYKCMNDNEKHPELGLAVGTKVSRGQDWRWNNQDNEGCGVIVAKMGWRQQSPETLDAVKVLWVANGKLFNYRYGADGAYDIKALSEQPIALYHPKNLSLEVFSEGDEIEVAIENGGWQWRKGNVCEIDTVRDPAVRFLLRIRFESLTNTDDEIWIHAGSHRIRSPSSSSMFREIYQQSIILHDMDVYFRLRKSNPKKSVELALMSTLRIGDTVYAYDNYERTWRPAFILRVRRESTYLCTDTCRVLVQYLGWPQFRNQWKSLDKIKQCTGQGGSFAPTTCIKDDQIRNYEELVRFISLHSKLLSRRKFLYHDIPETGATVFVETSILQNKFWIRARIESQSTNNSRTVRLEIDSLGIYREHVHACEIHHFVDGNDPSPILNDNPEIFEAILPSEIKLKNSRSKIEYLRSHILQHSRSSSSEFRLKHALPSSQFSSKISDSCNNLARVVSFAERKVRQARKQRKAEAKFLGKQAKVIRIQGEVAYKEDENDANDLTTTAVNAKPANDSINQRKLSPHASLNDPVLLYNSKPFETVKLNQSNALTDTALGREMKNPLQIQSESLILSSSSASLLQAICIESCAKRKPSQGSESILQSERKEKHNLRCSLNPLSEAWLNYCKESFPGVLTPISGQIFQSASKKIRACSHFPSATFDGVWLEEGSWYFEVTVLDPGLAQIGWCDAYFQPDDAQGEGCGDDIHSWAFDGCRRKVWNEECRDWGTKWKKGDVVGCAISIYPESRTLDISYSLNGSWKNPMGIAFCNVAFQGRGIRPLITFNRTFSFQTQTGIGAGEVNGCPEVVKSVCRELRYAPLPTYKPLCSSFLPNRSENENKEQARQKTPSYSVSLAGKLREIDTVENQFRDTRNMSENSCSSSMMAVLECCNVIPMQIRTKMNLTSPIITQKFITQLQDSTAFCANTYPKWVSYLAETYQWLLPFEARQQLFKLAVVGSSEKKRSFQGRRNDLNFLPNQYIQSSTESPRPRRTSRQLGERFEFSPPYRPIVHERKNKVVVERDSVLESAMKVLKNRCANGRAISVEFSGEAGHGLGPTREFFSILCKELSDPGLGIWNSESREMSYLFPCFQQGGLELRKREIFRLLGRLIATSISDGYIIDLPISIALCRIILNQSVDMKDYREIDKNFSQSVLSLRRLCCQYENLVAEASQGRTDTAESMSKLSQMISNMYIYFTVPGTDNRELIPGGNEIRVTPENFRQYLDRLTQVVLIEDTMDQVVEIKKGISDILPITCLRFFTPEEFQALLCQKDTTKWKAEEIRRNTICCHGYDESSPQVHFLVNVLTSFNADQRAKFLLFVTGSTRLPVGGWDKLSPKLTVVKKSCVSPDVTLPTCSTCQMYLKLPCYSSLAILRERLLYAIHNGQNYFALD